MTTTDLTDPMPSSDHTSPRVSRFIAAPIAVGIGDRVRWNGRYEGKVVELNAETAVVKEQHNPAFGHPVKWRIRLDALKRIEC